METLLYGGLALLGASMLLMVLEAFIPSGGLLGISSALCAIAGVVMLFNHSLSWGASGLLAIVVLAPIAFFGAMNILPATPMGQKLLGLETEEELQAKVMEERAFLESREALVGAQGETISVCRPVGEALIEGQRFEVHAEGELLEVGTTIRVVSAGRREIRVRRVVGSDSA